LAALCVCVQAKAAEEKKREEAKGDIRRQQIPIGAM
jgi:hypothetical protein